MIDNFLKLWRMPEPKEEDFLTAFQNAALFFRRPIKLPIEMQKAKLNKAYFAAGNFALEKCQFFNL